MASDADRYLFYKEDFPAVDFESITPSDSGEFKRTPRSIYVGGDGDIVAVSLNGSEVTFTGLVAGTVLPIQPIRVKSTGTTATNLVALY